MSEITTVRMPRGRVWHVQASPAVTWCGTEIDDGPTEQLGAQIPHGARICWRCVVAVNDYRNVVLGVALTDRRPEIVDAWPTLLDQHADDDEPDLSAPGDDEWPCGRCGHANLDHDCDDGTCTVTNDDPGVDWGECPCRGLKRAG